MKKAQTTIIIIIILLVVIAIGMFYVGYNLSNKPETTGNIVKDVLNSNDIQFNAFWRATTPTCNRVILRVNQEKVDRDIQANNYDYKNYNKYNDRYGEISFTFKNLKNNVFGDCEIYVNNQKTRVTFSLNEEIREIDSAYAGAYKAEESYIVKVCCGNVCKESLVNPLCY